MPTLEDYQKQHSIDPSGEIKVGRGSHLVVFQHEAIGSLSIQTGIDEISWSYNLNTQTYPTYGGEVVQILSCYVDDLTVGGTLRNFNDMEAVYTYFLHYMQIASQSGFNQEPMIFSYPQRGWEFHVIPTAAPGFAKGRDIVAPQWRITCHVADETGDVKQLEKMIISEAAYKELYEDEGTFGLNGEIGYVDENPFSDPFTEGGVGYKDRGEALQDLAGYYSQLIPSYLSGDFDAIVGSIGSQPAAIGAARGKALSADDDAAATDAIKKASGN